jgi:large subunit ribosomal protein L18
MMNKIEKRVRRKIRIRARVSGVESRPRLSVYRSNTAIYVQVVDDSVHKTIFSMQAEGKTIAHAKELGLKVAAEAKKKHIEKLVFDRGGYRYHGSIKALADAVREGGIQV